MKNFNVESPYYFCVVYQDLKIESPSLILRNNKVIFENQQLDDYSFFEYFNDYYQDTFLYNFSTPYMIYTGVGQITQLENLLLNQETQHYLNQKGLDIFFYENIFFDIGEKKCFSFEDVDPFSNPLVPSSDIINGFESTELNLNQLYCFELDSVEKFVANNKLTNVRVNTFDYNSKKYLQKKYSFSIETRDIFKISLLKSSSDPITTYTHNYNSVAPDKSTITHKFWAGAWRYTGYRHLLISYIKNKSSKYSWQHDIKFKNITNNLWFDLNRWKISHQEVYNSLEKGCLELENEEPVIMDISFHRKTCPSVNLLPLNAYYNCFCAVVSETKFAQPTGILSEKTVNAIKAFRPFILMAPPFSLEYAKKLGFKTFSQWWDESYDTEENHEKRLIKIFELLNYLDSKNIEDLKVLYDQIKPTVIYNFKNLENIKNNINFS
jgi:hypothetical protein